LGLGRSQYLEGASKRCSKINSQLLSLADTLVRQVESVTDPMALLSFTISAVTNNLRQGIIAQTADVIIAAVQSGQVQPQEVAVVHQV